MDVIDFQKKEDAFRKLKSVRDAAGEMVKILTVDAHLQRFRDYLSDYGKEMLLSLNVWKQIYKERRKYRKRIPKQSPQRDFKRGFKRALKEGLIWDAGDNDRTQASEYKGRCVYEKYLGQRQCKSWDKYCETKIKEGTKLKRKWEKERDKVFQETIETIQKEDDRGSIIIFKHERKKWVVDTSDCAVSKPGCWMQSDKKLLPGVEIPSEPLFALVPYSDGGPKGVKDKEKQNKQDYVLLANLYDHIRKGRVQINYEHSILSKKMDEELWRFIVFFYYDKPDLIESAFKQVEADLKLLAKGKAATEEKSGTVREPQADAGTSTPKVNKDMSLQLENIQTDISQLKAASQRVNSIEQDKAYVKKGKSNWEFGLNNNTAKVEFKPNKELRGLALVEFLLLHPDKEYTPLEVLQETGQRGKEATEPENIHTDAEIVKLKKNIEELEDLAKSTIDIEKRESLEQNVKDAKEILHKARNCKGKSRKFSDSYRLSVSRKINTVLHKIAPQNTQLYNHLDSFLNWGEICYYKPDKEMIWEIISDNP